MSIYGIELLDDNVAECRANLTELFAAHLGLSPTDELVCRGAGRRCPQHRPRRRPLHADPGCGAEADHVSRSGLIVGKGRYQRRDFRFETLTQMSSFGEEDSLFADLGKHEIFTPTKDHGTVTFGDLAGCARG
jgi:hypothetical protein